MGVVKSQARFSLAPFTAAQMRAIGTRWLETELARIRAGRNASGGASAALTEAYSRRKLKAGRAPLRDLFFTGAVLEEMRVTSASQTAVWIGSNDALVDLILTELNKREKVWGMSPEGHRAVIAEVRRIIDANPPIQFTNSVMGLQALSTVIPGSSKP